MESVVLLHVSHKHSQSVEVRGEDSRRCFGLTSQVKCADDSCSVSSCITIQGRKTSDIPITLILDTRPHARPPPPLFYCGPFPHSFLMLYKCWSGLAALQVVRIREC